MSVEGCILIQGRQAYVDFCNYLRVVAVVNFLITIIVMRCLGTMVILRTSYPVVYDVIRI
jgi:hypothetical protein